MFESFYGTSKGSICILTDTDFSCEIEISIGKPANDVRCIIKEYEKRGLPVADNILRFYQFYSDDLKRVHGWITNDKKWLDKHYPELEYSVKYYPKIKEKIDMLMLLS